MPSAAVIPVAQSDASQSISKWGWTAFGAVLSIVPMVNIFLLGISVVIVSVLTPHVDLSSPKRLEFYFQHPALYTAEYRKTAKRLRCMWMLYGWLTGFIILNFFF